MGGTTVESNIGRCEDCVYIHELGKRHAYLVVTRYTDPVAPFWLLDSIQVAIWWNYQETIATTSNITALATLVCSFVNTLYVR
jgi:hypothetical protein